MSCSELFLVRVCLIPVDLVPVLISCFTQHYTYQETVYRMLKKLQLIFLTCTSHWKQIEMKPRLVCRIQMISKVLIVLLYAIQCSGSKISDLRLCADDDCKSKSTITKHAAYFFFKAVVQYYFQLAIELSIFIWRW